MLPAAIGSARTTAAGHYGQDGAQRHRNTVTHAVLIGEAYHIMKEGLGMHADENHQTFTE
jgi:6-phosphogluconate dehydrogenase